MKSIESRGPLIAVSVLWGVAMLLALSILVGIQGMPLRDYREARYAQLAGEILESGEWLIPKLNGTPYLNKPPLVPWVVAISMRLFGKDEGAARLPAALATIGTGLCVGRFVSLSGAPFGGILGVLLFLGSPGVQYWGRMLSPDMVFTFFVLASLLAFLEGLRRSKKAYHILGFALSGLAIMCKGLAGLLYPVGSLLLFAIFRARGKVFQIPWFWGALVIIALCCPWFIAAELKESGFLEHHFMRQQLMRVAGDEVFVSLPRWEVMAGFLGFLGPLTLLLPCAFRWGAEQRDVNGLLWSLSLVVIASVMASSGRNHTYMIPALPPVVALVASGVDRREMSIWRWPGTILVGLLAGACLLGALFASDYLSSIHPRLAQEDTSWRISLGLGMVGGLLGAGAWNLARDRRKAMACLLAGAMLPGGWMLSLAQGALAFVESRKELATWISTNTPPYLPLIIVDPEDKQFEGTGGWNFYSGRKVLMVSFQDPKTVRAQAPKVPPWIISREEFKKMYLSGSPLILASTPQGIVKLGLTELGPPHASDGKFQVWILEGRSAEQGKSPAAHLHTGRMSSSSTWLQEG